MADKLQGVTKGATDQVGGATGKVGGAAGNAQSYVDGATQGILASVSGFANWITAKIMGLIDGVFPPEKRKALLDKLQSFMLANPKLSAFLGMNFALTGVPLFLFILFSITVFIFSLIVGLVVGLLAAVLFTLTMVGIALTIVFPAVFFTTMAATFLFLWGLGGYYIIKWANSGDENKDKEVPPGQSVGDRLNSFTGGRLSGFMDAARSRQSKGDISGYGDKYTPPKSEANGKPKGGADHHDGATAPKQQHAGAEKKVGDVTHHASKAADLGGAQKKVTDATGTVKGGAGAATSLVGL